MDASTALTHRTLTFAPNQRAQSAQNPSTHLPLVPLIVHFESPSGGFIYLARGYIRWQSWQQNPPSTEGSPVDAIAEIAAKFASALQRPFSLRQDLNP